MKQNTVTLAADRVIQKEDVTAAIENMNATLRGVFGGKFMGWGWHACVDVWLPQGTRIRITKSSVKGESKMMDQFVISFMEKMRERRYCLMKVTK